MGRFVCIHGHFYQPPRENPWIESIEVQDLAYPYHDWNERITAECYAPNAASRILDSQGRISRIVNNYAQISFNFGPTLLSWLKEKAPEVYSAIREADRESQRRFSGHGSAIAQPYNHMILPLANGRDKQTQVRWGIADFKYHFGRDPEGMWLPETAVDTETLEVLAAHGIQFTILAPRQAARVRKIGARTWTDVSGARIDPTMAYQAVLPSGRRIHLFFYDGPISQAVAFERLLVNGEHFAARLMHGFSPDRNRPQLVHIATDGETYGHHHRYGDMALAYALYSIEKTGMAKLTIYGEFLKRFPATYEVEIIENSSWSCVHGVERWRSDCGCNSGRHQGWNQAWRAPLRHAFDALRDTLTPLFETAAAPLLKDPWEARNDFISVMLDRSPRNLDRFFARHATRALNESDRSRTLRLLEMQRHTQLMYTSCGWFFDDISAIETVQVLQYASRAVQLGESLFAIDLEGQLIANLEAARSNVPTHRDGRNIYHKLVKPAVSDLAKIGANYAMHSLFADTADRTHLYCYVVDRKDYRRLTAGRAKLAVGRVRITSTITYESDLLTFGVLHLGDHNLIGGVCPFPGEEIYRTMIEQVTAAFSHADFPETIRRLDYHFGATSYTLKSLFHDEQRRILAVILDSTVAEAEAIYRQMHEHHAPLMRFLNDAGAPMPKGLLLADEFIVNLDLRRAFESPDPDLAQARTLLLEAQTRKIPLDKEDFAYAYTKMLERLTKRLQRAPSDVRLLERINEAAALARNLPFQADFWNVQNVLFALRKTPYPAYLERAHRGDAKARRWIQALVRLATQVNCEISADTVAA